MDINSLDALSTTALGNLRKTNQGAVIVDGSTITKAFLRFGSPVILTISEAALANFVEAFVIYDELYTDMNTLTNDDEFQFALDNFKDLIPFVEEGSIKDVGLSESGMIKYYEMAFEELQANENQYQVLFDIYDELTQEFGKVVVHGSNSIDKFPKSLLEHLGHPINEAMIIARTVFYLSLAYSVDKPYVPYSARVPFVDAFSKLAARRPLEPRKMILEYIQNETKNIAEEINDFFSRNIISVDIPAIYAIYKQQVASGKHPLAVLSELRNSPYTKSFREYCLSLESAIEREDIAYLKSTIQEMKLIAEEINGNYSVRTKSTVNVAIGPISIDVPLPTPKRKRKYVSFLHKISQRSFYT